MSQSNSPGEIRLIVNADDLGRTEGINRGIFEAHERGIVTSATLMVNYPSSAPAAARLGDFPALGIGLHVALTGGVPTLPPEDVPSLVGDDGRLPAKPEGLTRPAAGETLREVRAQLARFQSLVGRLPTHLDSHHHSHRIPQVCAALAMVAGELGVPVRNSGPPTDTLLAGAGVPAPEVFVERFFGAEARKDVLEEILASLKPGVTELMCHPAHVDAELRQGSSYVDEREAELAVLTDPEIRAVVARRGISLVTFAVL